MNNQEIYDAVFEFLSELQLPFITIDTIVELLDQPAFKDFLEILRRAGNHSHHLFLLNCQYVSIALVDKLSRWMDTDDYKVIFAGLSVDEIIDIINNAHIPSEEEMNILERLLSPIKP